MPRPSKCLISICITWILQAEVPSFPVLQLCLNDSQEKCSPWSGVVETQLTSFVSNGLVKALLSVLNTHLRERGY